MAQAIRSLQRLVFYLIITLILTISTLYLFHQFVATSISLPTLLDQAVRIVIIVGFWLAAIIIIRRFKPLISGRIGVQAATIVQYIMIAIAALFMTFGILNTLQVSASELLTGAGIISITVGLVISTFVGSILSGFLVFTNYQFRVGDNVIFNNIPGTITEMTALVMRIKTDVGTVTIPNSAIASGGVIITAVRKYEGQPENRLHYVVGDRVITSYMNEQGTVKEITPYHSVIQLDSGKEIIFLNNSILSGMVPIAKITQLPTPKKEQATQS
jgi:small-conductance mechanosensitive channel